MKFCCDKIYFKIIILNMCLMSVNGFTEIFNAEIIKNLKDHFSAKWIIIQSCQKFKNFLLITSILNQLKSDAFITVYDWNDFTEYQNFYESSYVKPMVLLTCWSCEEDCLLQMNRLNEDKIIPQFVWIALLNDSVLLNLNDLYLPIDSLFIIVKKSSADLLLNEVYQTSPQSPYYSNKIGIWNQLKGLDFNEVAFEERRANFFGQNMTVHYVLPHPGLELKYPFLQLETFLNITKRLNIEINLTDKYTDDFISASISYMSPTAPDSRFYFYPVILQKFVIFFKNTKSDLLIDSFIRPFDSTVWLILLSWVIITGYSSYKITKLLQFFHRKLRCFEFYQYIFETLSILFQKCETSNESFISQRIVKITQWFASSVIYFSYSAIFIAYVTVTIHKPPFTTLDGFLEDGRYNIVLFNVNASSQFFTEHKDVRIRKMMTDHYYSPLNQAKSVTEAVKLVCFSEKYFVTMQTFQRYEIAKARFLNCSLSDEYISLNIINLGFTAKRRNAYIRIFQYWLLKLITSGSILDYGHKKEKANIEKELVLFYPIETEHVGFLFFILLGATVAAFLILLLELHFYRLSKLYKSL